MTEHVNCREALDLLQDYLKRELTPELADEIKHHMIKCRPCFEHLRFEENFFQMLETRCRRETCPEKLRQRILDALRAETSAS